MGVLCRGGVRRILVLQKYAIGIFIGIFYFTGNGLEEELNVQGRMIFHSDFVGFTPWGAKGYKIPPSCLFGSSDFHNVLFGEDTGHPSVVGVVLGVFPAPMYLSMEKGNPILKVLKLFGPVRGDSFPGYHSG